MNTLRIYIDENLDSERLKNLRQIIQTVPHVVDVEFSDKDPHEVMVEYEAQQNLPMTLVEMLREQGYHPDILSA
jgi:cell division protein FtsX